jgi:Tfp pilus assembly protein PilO
MNARLRQLVSLAADYAFVSICAAVILVAGGAGYFLRQSIKELEHEHEFIRGEGETVLRIIAGAAALRSDRAAIEAAVREMNSNLITEENLADNLGYFYKIEEQSHARISELHQQTTPPSNGAGTVKTVPFSVNVTGTFAQVTSFLHQLEHGPRLMKITAFTFDRRSPAGDAVLLELNLEMLARP